HGGGRREAGRERELRVRLILRLHPLRPLVTEPGLRFPDLRVVALGQLQTTLEREHGWFPGDPLRQRGWNRFLIGRVVGGRSSRILYRFCFRLGLGCGRRRWLAARRGTLGFPRRLGWLRQHLGARRDPNAGEREQTDSSAGHQSSSRVFRPARLAARRKFDRSSPAWRAASETLPPARCKSAAK